MAKKSKMARNQRQLELIERYADLRKSLKEKGDYQALSKIASRLKSKSTEIPRPGQMAVRMLICENSVLVELLSVN